VKAAIFKVVVVTTNLKASLQLRRPATCCITIFKEAIASGAIPRRYMKTYTQTKKYAIKSDYKRLNNMEKASDYWWHST